MLFLIFRFYPFLLLTILISLQGIIEGPDEFAEGIARGAQSLMGHVVGGTADSLNLISSAIGNTIAVLSFDDDYKKVSLYNLFDMKEI